MASLPPLLIRPTVLRSSSSNFSLSGKENDKSPLSPLLSCSTRRHSHRLRSSSTSTHPPTSPGSHISRRQSVTDVSHRGRSAGRGRADSIVPRQCEEPALPAQTHPTTTYSFPRRLPRHAAVVQVEQIARLNPGLGYTTIKFLSDGLKKMAPLLRQGLTAVSTEGSDAFRNSDFPIPPSPGPSCGGEKPPPVFIRVPLKHRTGRLPTHVLAVVDPQQKEGRLYPIHAMLYAVHCATFPLPAGSLSGPGPEPETLPNHRMTLDLPLITVHVPHLASFHLINTYFYTESSSSFLRSLLPPLPYGSLPHLDQDVPSACAKLSRTLAETFTTSALMESIRFLHGVWSNFAMLGIAHEEMWKVLDLAWSIVTEAISLAVTSNKDDETLPIQLPSPFTYTRYPLSS